MRLTLFDFDGTLTRRDTLLPFLHHVAGSMKFAAGMAAMSPVLAAHGLRLMRNDRAKERVLAHFLRGMPIADLQAIADEFQSDRIPALLRPETMRSLAQRRRDGEVCVLVSASLDVYLKPWARGQGFAEVLCSSLETDAEGRVTGRLLGANCFGPEKVRRVQKWLNGTVPVHVTAYGDSRGDKELLAYAHEPHWV